MSNEMFSFFILESGMTIGRQCFNLVIKIQSILCENHYFNRTYVSAIGQQMYLHAQAVHTVRQFLRCQITETLGG